MMEYLILLYFVAQYFIWVMAESKSVITFYILIPTYLILGSTYIYISRRKAKKNKNKKSFGYWFNFLFGLFGIYLILSAFYAISGYFLYIQKD